MCYETDCMNFTAMYDCRESLGEGMKKFFTEINSCIKYTLLAFYKCPDPYIDNAEVFLGMH